MPGRLAREGSEWAEYEEVGWVWPVNEWAKLSTMFSYRRPVRLQDVDTAGIVFFPNFFSYAHEAMEQLFASIDQGYAGLITARRIGLPAVHVEADFRAPLRYGDELVIETTVTRLGQRSLELRYVFSRASDGVTSAEIRHTVVCTDLERMQSCAMPDDVRRVASSHLEPTEP